MSKADFRAGFVAVVGRPNVGKSTLVNRLVGEKISIVTPKPGTTRGRACGIVNRDDAQLILVDTPGIHGADSALCRAMRRAANLALDGADTTLLVVTPHRGEVTLSAADKDVIDAIKQKPGKVVVALNKIDRVEHKPALLPWMALYAEALAPQGVVPVSALAGDGLFELSCELVRALPLGPPLFPSDQHTDQLERKLCAELVREQVLLQLRAEVPHAAAVIIESFTDERREDGQGLVRLLGRIYVERESQKGIVVGRGGRSIQAISTKARQSIEQLLGCKVYLRLTVHVEPDWTASERAVARLGYSPDVEGETW